jgi:hypothetical protein
MSVESHFHNLRYLRINSRRLEHLATLMLPIDTKSVLEVGAGVGDLTSFFLDRGCSVTSIEPRPENIEYFRARYENCEFWPHERLRIVQSDVYSFTKFKISPHQVVFCYGLIYHLDKPLAALTNLAAHCTELLLIETAVAYGEQDGAISYHTEEASNLTNSVSGFGCTPTRRWMFERLRELFECVYMPLTQPAHDQFRLNWRKETAPIGRSRAIFVASRAPLTNSHLLEGIPDVQYSHLPQLGSGPARRAIENCRRASTGETTLVIGPDERPM